MKKKIIIFSSFVLASVFAMYWFATECLWINNNEFVEKIKENNVNKHKARVTFNLKEDDPRYYRTLKDAINYGYKVPTEEATARFHVVTEEIRDANGLYNCTKSCPVCHPYVWRYYAIKELR